MAAAGGAIALVQDGDTIEISIPDRSIRLAITDEELARREAAEKAKGKQAYRPAARARKVSNALRLYAHHVTSADQGAVRANVD
jgi:dihydroxy-acid dehydratase